MLELKPKSKCSFCEALLASMPPGSNTESVAVIGTAHTESGHLVMDEDTKAHLWCLVLFMIDQSHFKTRLLAPARTHAILSQGWAASADEDEED